MHRRLLLIALSFGIIFPAGAATYYVDNVQGSDSNSGASESTPWRSIAKVNSRKLQPGDSVLFHRGRQWRETIVTTHQGAQWLPITYGAYGTGPLPIVSGADPLSGWIRHAAGVWKAARTPDPGSLWFIKSDGTFEWGHRATAVADLSLPSAGDFDWTWSSGTIYVRCAESPGVRYASVEAAARDYAFLCPSYQQVGYIAVRDLELRFAAKQCLKIDIYGGSHWTIERVTAHHNGLSGQSDMLAISLCGDGHLVRGCTVYEAVGNGITLILGKNTVIEHNTVYNNHHNQIDIKAPASDAPDETNIVRYNHVFLDHISPNVTGISSYMVGVFTIAVSSGAVPTHMYYNLAHDMYIRGFQANGPTSVYMYNNVSLNSYDYDYYLDNENYPAYVINNIAVNTGGAQRILRVVDGRNKVIDYNCWRWNSGAFADVGGLSGVSSWSIYRSLTGFDAHSINLDPKFVDPPMNLRLQAGSPCINAGKDVGLTIDYEGNIVPMQVSVDMGAYEGSGGITPPSPAFSATPSMGMPPLEVRFINMSGSGGAPITQYTWNFGDGKSSNEVNPTHVYDDVGRYTVALTASNEVGTRTHSVSKLVQVVPELGIYGMASLAATTLLLAAAAVFMFRWSR